MAEGQAVNLATTKTFGVSSNLKTYFVARHTFYPVQERGQTDVCKGLRYGFGR